MLDGWTTPASGGVLWWGAFQVSPSPSFPWADPEHRQHPAKRYTRAAETIRQKKKRLIFSRAARTQPVLQVWRRRRMWNLRGGFMSHHKVCAHLREILLGECTWERGVCPNIYLVSLNNKPGANGRPAGLKRMISLPLRGRRWFLKLNIQAARKNILSLTSH